MCIISLNVNRGELDDSFKSGKNVTVTLMSMTIITVLYSRDSHVVCRHSAFHLLLGML